MSSIRAADGGYLLNDSQFNYTKDELGRPVLNIKGGQVAGAGGDFKSDGSIPMQGNLYMNGNNMGVKSISNTDSGMAIESEVSLNNHKIIDLLDPVAEQDATTKKYVDSHSLLGDDGKIDSNLDMNEHSIVNAHKISTDGPAPVQLLKRLEQMRQD